MSRKVTIDEVDAKILEQFQTDSTITNKDLAMKIGLSHPPTLVRVRNLMDQGFIQESVARLNWEKLGFKFEVTLTMGINKEDVWISEVLMRETEGVIELSRVQRNAENPRNLVHYNAKCVFRTDDDLIDAWRKVTFECNYNIKIEISKLEKRIIKKQSRTH